LLTDAIPAKFNIELEPPDGASAASFFSSSLATTQHMLGARLLGGVVVRALDL